ncbi:MAG: hypothetical protein ACP5N3_01390 [Candidatus Nanoarchaeia archaeon]
MNSNDTANDLVYAVIPPLHYVLNRQKCASQINGLLKEESISSWTAETSYGGIKIGCEAYSHFIHVYLEQEHARKPQLKILFLRTDTVHDRIKQEIENQFISKKGYTKKQVPAELDKQVTTEHEVVEEIKSINNVLEKYFNKK